MQQCLLVDAILLVDLLRMPFKQHQHRLQVPARPHGLVDLLRDCQVIDAAALARSPVDEQQGLLDAAAAARLVAVLLNVVVVVVCHAADLGRAADALDAQHQFGDAIHNVALSSIM